MKFFVALLALVAIVAAEEEWKPIRSMEPFNVIRAECIQESGITAEQLEEIAAFEYPDEEQVHKFVLCSALKMGVFDGERFSLNQITQTVDIPSGVSEKIEMVLNECMVSTAATSTPQNWAYRGFQCMLGSDVGVALKKAMQANSQMESN